MRRRLTQHPIQAAHPIIAGLPPEIDLEVVRRRFEYRDGQLYRREVPGEVIPWNSKGRPVGSQSTAKDCGKRKRYLNTLVNGKTVSVHRLIWLLHYATWPECIDHINGDSLDNRLENLRACTLAENQHNRRRHCGAVAAKGVSATPSGRYRANISAHGRSYDLGTYATMAEATAAYDAGAIILHGEFAATNREIAKAAA